MIEYTVYILNLQYKILFWNNGYNKNFNITELTPKLRGYVPKLDLHENLKYQHL